MKKSIFSAAMLLLLSAAAVFAQVTNQTIKVSDFHSISVNSAYTVYVKQSNKEEVTVKAEKDIFDISEFTVKDGVLHIDIKRDESSGNKSIWQKIDNIKLMPTLTVNVSIKDVENLSVNGNGKLITENSIAADKLNLLLAGSGSMEVDVKSKELTAKQAGTGSLTIKGYADHLNLENSGSGNVEAFNFEVETADVNVYGSATAKINVSSELDAKVFGSGGVHVKGGTKKMTKKEFGSGKVERK